MSWIVSNSSLRSVIKEDSGMRILEDVSLCAHQPFFSFPTLPCTSLSGLTVYEPGYQSLSTSTSSYLTHCGLLCIQVSYRNTQKPDLLIVLTVGSKRATCFHIVNRTQDLCRRPLHCISHMPVQRNLCFHISDAQKMVLPVVPIQGQL